MRTPTEYVTVREWPGELTCELEGRRCQFILRLGERDMPIWCNQRIAWNEQSFCWRHKGRGTA